MINFASANNERLIFMTEDKKNNLEGFVGLEIGESSFDDLMSGRNISSLVKVEMVNYSILSLYSLATDPNHQRIIVSPYYQRNSSWSFQQKCDLIESILLGIPLPVIYLFETKEGYRQVLDGRQRITTVFEFLENKFALKNLKILGSEYENKKFADLEPMRQGLFEDYKLLCYIIQPPTSERIKYLIFERVNRGGSRLNNQEMRFALYQGRATEMLKELSESDEFLDATENGISPSRMKDQYAILRLLAFFMLEGGRSYERPPVDYSRDLEDFLAKTMIYINNEMPINELEYLKYLFKGAMRKIWATIGHDAFRFAAKPGMRRPINMLLFEAIGYLFMEAEKYDWNLSNINFDHVKYSFDNSGLFNGKNESRRRVEERYLFIYEQMKKYDTEN